RECPPGREPPCPNPEAARAPDRRRGARRAPTRRREGAWQLDSSGTSMQGGRGRRRSFPPARRPERGLLPAVLGLTVAREQTGLNHFGPEPIFTMRCEECAGSRVVYIDDAVVGQSGIPQGAD